MIVYRGHANTNPAGGRLVTIEIDGETVGPLPHIARHSPTGMTWGYAGSGPADLALSLLVHALGERATCPHCRGTGRVTYDPTTGDERPGDPAIDDEDALLPCSGCEKGIPPLPHQAFKFAVVAALPDSWALARDEIVAWYEDTSRSGG